MIKELNKKYLKELLKIKELAFKPLEKKLGPYSEKNTKEYLEFTFKNGKIFGYFIRDHLVACVAMVINKKNSIIEVQHLAVNPEFQKKGLGKKLMKFVENYAKKIKIRELTLSTRIKNQNAINFYENRGFSKHAYLFVKKIK